MNISKRWAMCVLVVAVIVLALGMSSASAAVYDDEGQFLSQLGDYDLVDFNDVPTPPTIEITGDRYVESHGLLLTDMTGGGIWVSHGDGKRGLRNFHPSGGSRGEFLISFILDGKPVTVDGFGCWFGDVDTENRSGIWLYDSDDNLLDGGYVTAGGDGAWTFLGVTAQESSYARVIFDDAPGGVVMDDYYFTRVVPEPASLSLLALGGLALVRGKRK